LFILSLIAVLLLYDCDYDYDRAVGMKQKRILPLRFDSIHSFVRSFLSGWARVVGWGRKMTRHISEMNERAVGNG
jgi:hypothetical protein